MTDQRMFSWREHVQSARLPSTTKLVLLTLSTHMTRMGESCFPTTRQIAWECSLSRVSVMKHLGEAEKLGWIVRTEHGFAGQRWKNHEYRPAIPGDAKIVLWHESDDGIQARNERENSRSNVEKAGQPPLPSTPEAGQGGLPPSSEAGQPHDESWSTSRGKVVKEVDLSSSLALQKGVHDICDSDIEKNGSSYLNLLAGMFGYSSRQTDKPYNVSQIEGWIDNQYTIAELTAAVKTSIEGTGKQHPPLAYITKVLASNRQASKTGTSPPAIPPTRPKKVATQKRSETETSVGRKQIAQIQAQLKPSFAAKVDA